MISLLSQLSGAKKTSIIEPREIFMALPQKDKKYQYARDVQTEVWEKWFSNRDNKNCIIKMNTGSGKTVVGLLILQSCINEGKGPAIYIVPDKYLVSQVLDEAKNLGISATDQKDSYLYTENKAILVATIHSLINGHSVFGMNHEKNYPIGSILMDDVHSCFEAIIRQFSVLISASEHEQLYNDIINLFADDWKAYNRKSYLDIVENSDPTKQFLIPFWMWQRKYTSVYELLIKHTNNSENLNYTIPLLEDSWETSDCFITAGKIAIIPEGIQVSKITNFENAPRRIFMSATLADDSIFSSVAGIDRGDLSNIIVPDYANDIGDRLILFPKHLNNNISDEEIKDKIFELSKTYNVAVIVPSFKKALFWDPEGIHTVRKENIESTVRTLKSRHVGLSVFVNRYDGIDLPDDACRVLVIDDLPPLANEKEKYIQSSDPSNKILIREQMQRVEQGMGRGVRSNGDSCCVVLMGNKLADVLLRNHGVDFFSNTTKEQYHLSNELWDLLINLKPHPSIDDIFELADYSLNREVEWIRKSKARLSNVKYPTSPQIDDNVIALREAFEQSIIQQPDNAISILDKAINTESNRSTKGYLMQIKAKYLNLVDQIRSQETLLSARAHNKSILVPITGVRYEKRFRDVHQAKGVCQYIVDNKIDKNQYVVHFDSVMSDLDLDSDSDCFEQAVAEIGRLLGFDSSRPDKETCGAGPDNLWGVENGMFFVIECKNEATSKTISKDYCNQLAGSIRWFEKTYENTHTVFPIMIHPSSVIDKQATAVNKMKLITANELDALKSNLRQFAVAVSQDVNWEDEEKIQKLLTDYHLRGKDIVQYFTTDPQET